MKKNIILFILLLLLINTLLYATPEKLINNESAAVLPSRIFELREDIVYSSGYIENWAIRTQARFGLFGWLEIPFVFSLNYFPDISSVDALYQPYYYPDSEGDDTGDDFDLNNPRLSYIESGLKLKLPNFALDFDMNAYIKYKIFIGDPIIVPYPEDGIDTSAVAVTSFDAAQGNELTAGTALKIPLYKKSSEVLPSITLGIEYKQFADKDWLQIDPFRDGTTMFAGTIVPELVLLDKWMLQLENRVEWWIDRGWQYEILPGISWEVRQDTFLDFGISIPLNGGDVTRMFVGFSYKFGSDKILIRLYDIHFPPNSPNLYGFSGDEKYKIDENKETLDDLADKLLGYPDYDITIEGHTSSDHWSDPEAFEKEQVEELLPLSKARAQAVEAALVERGLDPSTITTESKGGSEPIVPFQNLEEQWRNRRVDIVLTKRKQVPASN